MTLYAYFTTINVRDNVHPEFFTYEAIDSNSSIIHNVGTPDNRSVRL
jgi:hypothetical protein